jgi:hypothetical protein
LLRGGGPGDRLGELLARNEKRRERLGGRTGERARGPRQRQGQIKENRVAHACRDQAEQQRRGARLDEMRRGEQAAAVDAVGELARRQGEERDRHEGGEPGPAERHRIAGEIVEVPADRDPLHLRGQHRKEAPAEKQREIADSKDVQPP